MADFSKYFSLDSYISYFLRRIGRLLGPIEVSYLKKKCLESEDICAPIFILGVPRSGSTIAYQLITKYLDVQYIDNLTERLYFIPYMTSFIKRFFQIKNKHSSFSSNYGDTSKDGLLAPNQGIEFWYRWMPNREHHHQVEDMSSESIASLRQTVNSMTSLSGKPFLFKELSLSQKIPVLESAFPKAKYIVIERNKVDVAKSIYKAMEKLKFSDGVMWGGQFEGYEHYLDMPREKMIPHQVYNFNRLMWKSLNGIDENRVLVVKYEDVCTDISSFLSTVSEFTRAKCIDGELPELKIRAVDIPQAIVSTIEKEFVKIENSTW